MMLVILRRKKKDDSDDDGSDNDSGEGNSSASSDSDDDDDDTDKYKCEKRGSGKGEGGSSSKAPGGSVDDDTVFWNEKLRSLSDDDKKMYRQMLTDRVWTIDMTRRFSEIFESSDRMLELEYNDPDLEDGEVSAAMSKEILEGLAKQVGKTLEE